MNSYARKTRLKLLSPLAVIAMAFGCSAVWAAGGVHEHGAADLLLSSEGKDVQITFNAPAQSLVGFETAAVTAQQKTAVERLEAVLSEPSALFVLEGTFCELIDAVVDVSSITGVVDAPSPPREHGDHAEERAAHKGEHAEHADEHAEHASDHIDLDEDHANRSDNHEHEHHNHNDGRDAPDVDSHSDVSATYTLKCDSENALTRIALQHGALSFGLERIDVFWVASWGQGADQATPESPIVNLRN